ncbi:hypothetical protein GGI35DRAFT_334378 [Trichoderma velutinum]
MQRFTVGLPVLLLAPHSRTSIVEGCWRLGQPATPAVLRWHRPTERRDDKGHRGDPNGVVCNGTCNGMAKANHGIPTWSECDRLRLATIRSDPNMCKYTLERDGVMLPLPLVLLVVCAVGCASRPRKPCCMQLQVRVRRGDRLAVEFVRRPPHSIANGALEDAARLSRELNLGTTHDQSDDMGSQCLRLQCLCCAVFGTHFIGRIMLLVAGNRGRTGISWYRATRPTSPFPWLLPQCNTAPCHSQGGHGVRHGWGCPGLLHIRRRQRFARPGWLWVSKTQ